MNWKRKALVFACYIGIALTLCGVVNAQQLPTFPNNGSPAHWVGGVYQAAAYATYQAPVLNTLTGTGTQTYIVGVPTPLRDGTSFAYNMATLFNTNTPLQFADANTEVVTPTSVSIGPCPTSVSGGPSGSALCASITASFANAHGYGTKVFSGDSGIQEAITDASNNGGGLVYWLVDIPTTTLATGATSSTFTVNGGVVKVPTNFYNAGASCRVETTLTGPTSWSLGISGATAIFSTLNSTLTSGTSCVANMAAPASTGTTATLTNLILTSSAGNITAGAVRARIWGWTPVQSAN